jgi:hypothetical protein
MTFLNSFFNNLSNVDELFLSYKSYHFHCINNIFNFNKRVCRCCECVEVDYENKYWELYNSNCGKIGDKYHCFREYARFNNIYIKKYYEFENDINKIYNENYDNYENYVCKCNCVYKTVGDNVIILNNEQIEKLVLYLKNKNINPKCADFSYSKHIKLYNETDYLHLIQNYKKNNNIYINYLYDNFKNNLLIKIYNIDIRGLNICLGYYEFYYTFYTLTTTYIFRIMSGMGSLSYGEPTIKNDNINIHNLFEEFYIKYNF